MTIPVEHRQERTDYLASLLPPHVMARDAESGGLLRQLLGAVAGELALVERDLGDLYDSWFVETAPEWVLPYLADLVGLVGLPADFGAPAGVSRRAVIANTVAYRQRKGTVAVLEQVVRDVTGWPAKAVEYHPLLGTTTHVNHSRLDRPAWGTIRGAASTELESPRLAAGALTRFAHTGEVRPIDPGRTGGRGRYNICDVGVFVFPVQVSQTVDVPARRTAAGWTVHPLGFDQPLFVKPAVEAEVEHLATEADLPVPLRPRRLLAALIAARAGTKGEPIPLSVSIDGAHPLTPDRVRVCGLETLAALPGWQVMVDTVRGVLHPILDGVAADPAAMHLRHDYGALADVGAGTYDRSLAHEEALAGEAGVDANRDRIARQVGVGAAPRPGFETSIGDGLAAIHGGWGDTAATTEGAGGSQVLSVVDSEVYPGNLTVAVPERRRILLVAADWPGRTLPGGDVQAPVPGRYSPDGQRPRVVGNMLISGDSGSAVVLDGLVIEGDVEVQPGSLQSLTISQCTIAGRVRVLSTAPDAENDELIVALRRCLVGGVDLADTVPNLAISDSVLDPQFGGLIGPVLAAPGTSVEIHGSTLFGQVGCRLLSVSSSICDGLVLVADRQRGCARFSYFGARSRTPRRFRCVPANDAGAGTDVPTYLASDPGSPYYPGLAVATPASIRRGGEFGAEMGVHHHLRRPLRMDAARRLVEPYLPAGMNLGLFGS